MFDAYEEETSLFSLFGYEAMLAEEEYHNALREQMLAEARRRGHHDQRRRAAFRHDGPHEWYPLPQSFREEESRDDRHATRAALAEMRQEAHEAMTPAADDDAGEMDYGDDVYVTAGAAIYDPPNE